MHFLPHLVEHFGYLGIFIALCTGIIGLPLPDELLLTYVGFLVFNGDMSYILSLISSFAGAVSGISISYLLGIKLGLPFLNKYGPKLHLSKQNINNTRDLFTKIGPALLLVGYFIPGVRHLTAYVAGINGYSFKKFAFYAYSGAFLWVFSFITLGKNLGKGWKKVHVFLSAYSLPVTIVVVVLCLIAAYIYQKRK